MLKFFNKSGIDKKFSIENLNIIEYNVTKVGGGDYYARN